MARSITSVLLISCCLYCLRGKINVSMLNFTCAVMIFLHYFIICLAYYRKCRQSIAGRAVVCYTLAFTQICVFSARLSLICNLFLSLQKMEDSDQCTVTSSPSSSVVDDSLNPVVRLQRLDVQRYLQSIHPSMFISQKRQIRHMRHTLVQTISEWCNKTQQCTNNYTIKRKRINLK